MITIVDYNTGNLGSIMNMLKKIRVESVIAKTREELAASTKIILPGVGSFDSGMSSLMSTGLAGILNQKVLEEKVPVLGICLGMQLMSEGSEEGSLAGLGWIKGKVLKFSIRSSSEYKIPHMGWNFIRQTKESRLFAGMYPDPRFYFVHSYHVKPENESDIITVTHYEDEFVSSFERNNILGVQFHPEKSHKFGMLLLKNFAELY